MLIIYASMYEIWALSSDGLFTEIRVLYVHVQMKQSLSIHIAI